MQGEVAVMNETIRIMIVDDHEVVRRSLNTALSFFDDLVLIGDAADGQEAVDLSERLRPDVILMDVLMPRMDGLEATRTILARSPGTRVLVLTSQALNGVPEAALEAGAVGCVSKDVSTEELAEMLRSTARYCPVPSF